MFKSFWNQRYPTHHKHAGNEVFESTETSVGDVFNRISEKFEDKPKG